MSDSVVETVSLPPPGGAWPWGLWTNTCDWNNHHAIRLREGGEIERGRENGSKYGRREEGKI